MPALFVFLLKENVALIVFCLGYYLVLRKLTFYTLNRVYLVVGIVFSSVYPLVNIDDFISKHEHIAAPVQKVAINWKASEQFIQQPGYWQWAVVIFWLGAMVMAIRFLVQLLSLYKLYRNSEPATIQNHDVRVTKANISPFSFWQSIYINPDNLAANDLKSVIQHEQVHVKEWHTLDILLAELSVIFYWFNPGVWLMKRAVSENIEFITDRKILQQGTDTKTYQYSLLNVSLAENASAGITNHFNFSTLKKRIKMMNAKRSSNLNLTRYAVLVPMVMVLLLVFSFSKAELIKENRKQLTRIIATTIGSNVDVPTKSKAPEPVLPVKKVKAKTSKPVQDTIKTKNQDVKYISIKGTAMPIGAPIAFFRKDGYKMGDTTIKTVMIYKGDDKGSVSYVIDGKNVTREEFLKSAPKDFDKVKAIEGRGVNGGQMSSTWVNGKTQIVATEPLKITFKKAGDSTIAVYNTNFSYRTSGQPAETVVTDNTVQRTAIAYRFTVIDGKEASEKEIKKLPLSDIESIDVKKGEEMVNKYGEKAKNGVLFITTKKGK